MANQVVQNILNEVVGRPLEQGGDLRDTMVILEAVLIGVFMLMEDCAEPIRHEKFFDIMIKNVRERMLLYKAQPAGRG